MASSLFDSTKNLSAIAIPFYYLLCILPHAYAIGVASRGNPVKWDNRNPRSEKLKENLKKALSPAAYGRYERAEAAHYNALESLAPLTAAVVLGNLAKLPVGQLNNLVIGVSVLRFVHMVVYIGTTKQIMTPVRTLVWYALIGWILKTMFQAGYLLLDA